MSPSTGDDLAQLLRRAQEGDLPARDRVVERLYQDLHAIAHRRMRRERPDHTLQTTALLNEALAKILSDDTIANATDLEFLLRAASRAMERILIDHHRHRSASKGPGNRERTPLDAALDHLAFVEHIPAIDLNEALLALELVDMRSAWVARYKFVLGMSVAEVADSLGISQKTVERDWRFARGWLYARLKTCE